MRKKRFLERGCKYLQSRTQGVERILRSRIHSYESSETLQNVHKTHYERLFYERELNLRLELHNILD